MLLSPPNGMLLRNMLAGAVALVAASGCSRSDRSNTGGRDTAQTGAVAPTDTQPSATPQPIPADTGMADTSTKTRAPTSRVHSDSNAKSGKQGAAAPSSDTTVGAATPPADTAASEMAGTTADTTTRETTSVADSTSVTAVQPADSSQANVEGVADTAAVSDTMPADHAIADTAAAPEVGDSAAAGYEPMARDTSTALAQGDSASQTSVDTTEPAQADTTAIHAQADTTTGQVPTDVAVESQADTVTVVGDSSSVDKPGPRAKEDTVSSKADSMAQHHDADRVRPPEDSTEVLGNVTSDEEQAEADQANADRAAAAAAPVPSTGNIATGAEAVALMTRSGERCAVVDPDDSRDVLWDLASSPATMNPCGTGTMTLPKIWTGEKK